MELPPLDGPVIPPQMRLPEKAQRDDIRRIIRNKIKEKKNLLENANLFNVKESDNETSVNEGSRR